MASFFVLNILWSRSKFLSWKSNWNFQSDVKKPLIGSVIAGPLSMELRSGQWIDKVIDTLTLHLWCYRTDEKSEKSLLSPVNSMHVVLTYNSSIFIKYYKKRSVEVWNEEC